MDPITGALLLTAQLGLKRAIGAIAGDDVGGLAAAFLGLVAQAQQSQDRLIAIETKLDELRDDPFSSKLRDGTRLVERALGRRGDSEERARELAEGQRMLEQAVSATEPPMSRALAERMVIVVQLLRGDLVAAQHSCRMLDAAVGDAVVTVGGHIYERARRRLRDGEYGTSTWIERRFTDRDADDRRGRQAFADSRAEVDEAMIELAELLEFGLRASALVGLPTGYSDDAVRAGGIVRLTRHQRIVVPAPLEHEIRLGGVAVVLDRPQRVILESPSLDAPAPVSGTVSVDAMRRVEAACSVGDAETGESGADGVVVAHPGRTVTVEGTARGHGHTFSGTVVALDFGLKAGGILFATRVLPPATRPRDHRPGTAP